MAAAIVALLDKLRSGNRDLFDRVLRDYTAKLDD